jgi:hypothetical protein
MVCEATGGYERALMRVAKQRGLPLRRAHPNRALSLRPDDGQARPKTDALDARMLAAMTASKRNSQAVGYAVMMAMMI